MSTPITISTKKREIILPEGKLYYTPFGAGTELKLSRIRRRMAMCENKIFDKTASDDTYDAYDAYEAELLDIILEAFTDDVNGELAHAYVMATPLVEILKYIEGKETPDAETKE